MIPTPKFTAITEAENEKALAVVEELMHRCDGEAAPEAHRTPEEDELYELLIILIEKFEQEYYQPQPPISPESMLQFLLEQRDLKPEDLVDLIGSQEKVNELINGLTPITQEQAIVLSQYFKVDQSVFFN